MSFITTKFHEILLIGFRGVVLTKCFSSIFHFRQISKFKKGHCSQKKNWIRISYGYAHLHIMSFITTKFQEILFSGFRGVALTNCFSSIFHFGQISKFKKGVIQRNKLNQKFLWICTSTHYVLHYYKVSGNSVERFQRSCADKLFGVVSFILKFCWAVSEQLRKQEKQDWLTDWMTDWLTDGSKTLYPAQLVAWGIINLLDLQIIHRFNIYNLMFYKGVWSEWVAFYLGQR